MAGDAPGAGVLLRLAPSLRPLLRRRPREAAVAVPADGASTLGHLVQSVGVPLTEVGALRLDGRAVAASYLPQGGEVVDVDAVRLPQQTPTRPPRFLLDVHLGALARRLRIVGADAAYEREADDPDLAARAAAEQRVLLTRDRGLLSRRVVRHGALVRSDRPDDQLVEVVHRFALPVLPSTRCPACNGVVVPTAKSDVADLLPQGTRRSYETFAACTTCGKVYWPGAHAAALDRLVAAARQAGPALR